MVSMEQVCSIDTVLFFFTSHLQLIFPPYKKFQSHILNLRDSIKFLNTINLRLARVVKLVWSYDEKRFSNRSSGDLSVR